MQSIKRIRKQLVEEGFDGVLSKREYKQKVFLRKNDGEARLIAICCGDPTLGRIRWKLRLLVDKIVELDCSENISYESTLDLNE